MSIGATCLAQQQQPKVVQTFELREWYGVSHPEQIIDFDLKQPIDPKQCGMLGPDGKEVIYQVLSQNRVAIRTDLPADAVKTWTLVARKPQAPAPDMANIVVSEKADVIEITQNQAGVRVPRISAAVSGKDNIPAPIQAVRYRDGSWVGGAVSGAPVTLRKNPPVTTMTVSVQERGPLVTQVLVEYAFNRPERKFEKGIIAAGPGYYRSTIRVEAGQPSIMIVEDTDTDFCYSLNLYPGLAPDQGRYRGHHSSSVAKGRLPDGSPYDFAHKRANMDAMIDLDCTKFMEPGPVYRETLFPRMSQWNPWAKDTGWYWMLYNKSAPANGNLLGIFHGRPSLVVGPGDSGVGFYFGQDPKLKVPVPAPIPAAGAAPAADAVPAPPEPQMGLEINFNRRDWGAQVSPRIRYEWGLFTGTKGQDLKAHDQTQTIGLQQNLHAGISLSKLHRFAVDYPDSKATFAGMFADPSVFERLQAMLRAEPPKPGVKNFGSRVASEDELSRKWLELWADTSGAKSKEAVARILSTAKTLLNAYVNGAGVYDHTGQYWKGGSQMNSAALTTAYLMGTNELSLEDRAKLKAIMVMFGAVLWDMDFVPLFDGHNLNQGNLNMPPMQYSYQDSLALTLSEHPLFKERAKNVGNRTIRTQDELLRDNGVQSSAVHYVSASMDGTLSTLLRVKRMGGPDPFATEPKIARFAEFYMNFVTPPEPRFGGLRKIVAIGDGCYESSTIFGKLGTGLRDANPEISARAMGVWNSMGKPHSGFFGLPTRMQIDEEAPSADPALRSGDYRGYYSVIRHGWGTSDESAAWIVNGDTYNDHRHGDHGSFILYALGVPLSLDWGSMYEPRSEGAYAHSMAVSESHMFDAAGKPISWSQDGPPVNVPENVWEQSSSTGFCAMTNSARVGGSFKLRPFYGSTKKTIPMIWNRSIQSIHFNPSRPIYVVRDRFESAPGQLSDQPVIVSTNLAAQGPVTLPSGETFTPVPRMHPSRNSDAYIKEQLPSAGPVMKLSSGVNQMRFTGQFGVDWDVAIVTSDPSEALLGAWGHMFHPSGEANQFRKAMNMPFEERQYILRVRGSGAVTQVILPYRNGQRPQDISISAEGESVTVVALGDAFTIGPNTWTLKAPEHHACGTFDGSPVTIAGWNLSGAPAEVTITQSEIYGTLGAAQTTLKIAAPSALSGKTLTLVGQKPVRLSGSSVELPAQSRATEFTIR